MCGIGGVIWHLFDTEPDEVRLGEMARLLRHRGPDGAGIHRQPGIGLVHTRLSLLDLQARSNQPFWDRERRHALVYNGEIYNFIALREELELLGKTFHTTSDTEVLLEALLAWGVEQTVARLEGMFAFGWLDCEQQILVLARDRFGIKPLFVYLDDTQFVFASEIRALRPWITLQADLLSLASFVQGYGGPTRGFTFFRKVKFLDPGTILILRRGGRPEIRTYSRLVDFVDPVEGERLKSLKPVQLVDALDEALNRSVRSQLIADAPVGALCSGGVDSSVLLAIAARYHPDLAIFHADVVGPMSERSAAARLADHLKLDLRVVEVKDSDLVERIPEAMVHYGHPFYVCSHSIPFLMVSRLVRGHGVKGILTGEGADEAFLGYRFSAPNFRAWFRLSTWWRWFKQSLARHGPENGHIQAGLTYWGPSPHVGLDSLHRYAGRRTPMHLLNRFEVMREAMEDRQYLNGNHAPSLDPSLFKSLDIFHYTLRSLLHRNDSMGMAAGIESRFPFLDSTLVRTAINLPYSCKIHVSPREFHSNHLFYCDKWILRQVADRYLPKELSQREKQPFPVNAYDESRLQISPDLLENGHIAELFELTRPDIRFLFEHSWHDLRWRLIQLEVWARVCLVGEGAEQVVPPLRRSLAMQMPA